MKAKGARAVVFVICGAAVFVAGCGNEANLSTVGVTNGANPSLTEEEQQKAYAALKHSVSLKITQWEDWLGTSPTRVTTTVTDQADIHRFISWLEFKPLGPQKSESLGPVLRFRLPNDRYIIVHVRDGEWWCFTGGVRRELNPELWDYLESVRREYGISQRPTED